MFKRKCCPLSKCHRRGRVKIVNLAMDRRLAHRCCEMGLGVGETVEVLEAESGVIISHHGSRMCLNHSMADEILVALDG